MQKYLYKALCLCSAALLAACSDDHEVLNNNDGNVSLTVTLPGQPQSRAYGDGTQATRLQYYVYETSTTATAPVAEGVAEFQDALSTNVTLKLVNGREYDVVFWADSYGTGSNVTSPYTINTTDKTVTVSYDNLKGNAEERDAFYGTCHIETVTAAVQKSVTLKRPFAQINLATSDLDEEIIKSAYMEGDDVKVFTAVTTKAANVLSLTDGSVSGEVNVTVAQTGHPANTTINLGGKDYGMLQMNYLLAPAIAATQLADFKIAFYASETATTEVHSIEVNNVPLQANYRTNIYGQLLTSNGVINVEKDANWGTPDTAPLIWDGSVIEPTEKDGVYTVTTPAELAGIAKIVNDGNFLSGKTVKLVNDIDLNNLEWTPIGNVDDNAKGFGGTFDGQGHTISNLKIENATSAAGLFGYTFNNSPTLKNVKIDGVDINVLSTKPSKHANGALLGSGKANLIENVIVSNVKIQSYRRSGGIVGSIYGSIKDCSANNIEITLSYEQEGGNNDYNNGDKAGGIVGHYPGEGNYTFAGNTANNVTITGGRDLGGLVGYAGNTQAYSATNNKVYNVTITQILPDGTYGDTDETVAAIKPSKFATVGGIAGYDGAGTFAKSNNNAYNVSITRGDFEVSSPNDVVAAIANGFNISVPENTTLDLSTATAEQLTANSPLTIEIPDGSSIKLGSQYITANDGLTLKATSNVRNRSTTLTGGTITNVGSDPYEDGSKGLIVMRGGELIIDNMTLINDTTHHRHGSTTYNSAAINYYGNSKITITNSKIYSGEFTLCGYGVAGVNTSVIYLKDSYFESTSSSKNGTGNWSYNMRLNGATALLENCEVKGVQGGVSPNQGCIVTIKSGKYYTVNSAKGDDAYYPVYCTAAATVIIEGGEFIGARNLSNLAEGTSCVVSGDNDTDKPLGFVIIKGGKFSGKAYNHVTNSVYQADDWVALDGEGELKWTIKQ